MNELMPTPTFADIYRDAGGMVAIVRLDADRTTPEMACAAECMWMKKFHEAAADLMSMDFREFGVRAKLMAAIHEIARLTGNQQVADELMLMAPTDFTRRVAYNLALRAIDEDPRDDIAHYGRDPDEPPEES